jgi:hypothetical protein
LFSVAALRAVLELTGLSLADGCLIPPKTSGVRELPRSQFSRAVRAVRSTGSKPIRCNDAIFSGMIHLFLPDKDGYRPIYGPRGRRKAELFAHDPHWRDLILYYEYFNGDTGEGLGASHQTGWTRWWQVSSTSGGVDSTSF